MWSLFQQAKEFSRLPSELLKVYDELAAYQFNDAVLYFGRWVENKLEERDAKGNRINHLDQLLGVPRKVSAIEAMSIFEQFPGAVKKRKAKATNGA